METNAGTRVKVYFNLHKKVWSVLHMTPKGWRLYGHFTQVTLADVTWKVSEAGRQRVLREQRKNVHAFGIGTMVDYIPQTFLPYMGKVSYNPYKAGTFMQNDFPINVSSYARFGQDRSVSACISGWEIPGQEDESYHMSIAEGR